MMRNNKGQFVKGHKPYNYWKGKKRSKSTNRKISQKLKGNKVAFKNGFYIRASGKNNAKWKGDKVGYWGLHSWLIRKLGKASNCGFCHTRDKRKRYEWALIGKEHKRDVQNYMSLCKRCHNYFDGVSVEQQK